MVGLRHTFNDFVAWKGRELWFVLMKDIFFSAICARDVARFKDCLTVRQVCWIK